MQINKIYHNFVRNLAVRLMTNRVILHHSKSGDVDSAEIHRWHLARGWAGIGYHFIVRYDGSIETGRPMNAFGAHAKGANGDSIGICIVGNFETHQPTKEQLDSVVWLISEVIFAKYGKLEISGHSDHGHTLCPGRYFPMGEVERRVDEFGKIKSEYFDDVVEEWQIPHVDNLRKCGIISGRIDKKFDPDSYMTRAETAVAMNKMLEYIEMNFKSKQEKD